MLRKRQASSSLFARRQRLLYTGISSGMCSSSTLRQVTRSGLASSPSLSYQILNSGQARSKKVFQRSPGQGSLTSLRCTYMQLRSSHHLEPADLEQVLVAVGSVYPGGHALELFADGGEPL